MEVDVRWSIWINRKFVNFLFLNSGGFEMKKNLFLFVSLFSLFFITAAHAEVTFEDLTLAPASSWNGSDLSGGFTSGGAAFNNAYNATYSSWSGFGYSNKTDTTLTGSASAFNAIPGSGAQGSANYGVGYVGNPQYGGVIPTTTFPIAQSVTGFYVTNNNYAYYSMLNGDAFAKKFEAGDWFLLTITGKNTGGATVGTVETYLAQGTNILNTWKWVDLSGLGSSVKSLEFTLTSSDTGMFGMNTPAYFCIDNINQQRIPTLSEWGMIMFIILLIGMALWTMRKGKTTAPA
jgi:hypothetical protein